MPMQHETLEQRAPGYDCAMVLDAMRAKGGWHTVRSLHLDWHPTYSITQMRSMLQRLHAEGLVQRALGTTSAEPLVWSADLELAPPAPKPPRPVRSRATGIKPRPAAAPNPQPRGLQALWMGVRRD